jgi:mannose-6-phosphate isomerase-like protein (cupin superfamily)
MRKIAIAGMAAVAIISLGWIVRAQGAQAGNPQPTAPPAPTTKAAYFDSKEIHEIWKDEEAKNVINRRVAEGGSHSINIRIVLPTNAPLVHALSADTWVVMEGSATAVTGGELMEAKRNPNSDDMSGSSIRGGVEQPLKPGDILFVPPGVPHGFKDIKGFRAYLIRYPTK